MAIALYPRPVSSDAERGGFPPEFFARLNEEDDARFYVFPRLVTHIDDDAIAAVGELYEELGIGGDVLDLMSSWVSHFRTPPAHLRVLGMNEDELRANPVAAERIVHDLNADPGSASDRVRRRRRLLRLCRLPHPADRGVPGRRRACCGPAAGSCARSATGCSRRRPSGAGSPATDTDRCAIVAEYFSRSGGFGAPTISRRSPPGHRGDPLFAVWASQNWTQVSESWLAWAMPTETPDRYTIISADTHAGGSHRDVPGVPRPRVARRVRRVAGEVQEPVEGPARHRPRPQLGRRAARRRPAGRRRRRRGALPQHRAAVLPELRAVRRAADSRRTTPAAGPACRPTTAGWSTSAPPSRAACRHRPDLPERRRRRDRGREWIKEHGLRGGVLLPTVPPDVKWVRAALRPRVRPALGGVRGPRHPRAPARRHRLARLRPLRGGADDLDRRGAASTACGRSCTCCSAACSSASRG